MPSGVVSNVVTVRSDPGPEPVRAVAAPSPPPPSSPDLRLNIVQDQASGLFVYKFVDPTTGHVVHQFPDEEMIKLRTAAEYAAGRLISTRA
ncbi:MAG: flaG [Phenylobacterium sp.]|jgi:hypothetical protein|nr:flaG [Phenylobacterium sp.]